MADPFGIRLTLARVAKKRLEIVPQLKAREEAKMPKQSKETVSAGKQEMITGAV